MEEAKQKSPVSLSKLFFYALSLLIFYLLIRYMGKLEDIKKLLAEMNPLWIIGIVSLQVATYVFYSLILRTLLYARKLAPRIRFMVLYKMAVVLVFVNQALPSGGISGNGYVLDQLVKRNTNAFLAFKALAMESISYYIAFVSILIGTYLSFSFGPFGARWHNPVFTYTTLTGIVFFACLAGVVLLVGHRKSLSFIARKLSRFRFLRKYLDQIEASLAQEGPEKGTVVIGGRALFNAVVFQLCLIACDILTVSCLLYAFHIHLPLLLTMLAVLLSMVVGALPVSPGSLIVYEGAMTFFLTNLGVPVHAAIVVTLLYRFFTFWLPMPIGLVLYRKLQKERPGA